MLNSRSVPAQGNIIGLAALGLQRGERSCGRFNAIHMGLSENSVPLNPMVNDHYHSLSLLNGYNWEYTLFSDTPIYSL